MDRPVTLEALKCAPSVSTGREREIHFGLAVRAGWAINFRHGPSSNNGLFDGRLFISLKY
jgi:hypothetical protein